MKLKEGFMLCDVAGSHVVMPFGEMATNLQGMIRLNESGCLLWKELEKGGDAAALAKALVKEYDLEPSQAEKDAEEFLAGLREVGCLEE